MHYTQHLTIASIVTIPALVVLGSFALIASADGGKTSHTYQTTGHHQQQSEGVSYTLTVHGLHVTYGNSSTHDNRKDEWSSTQKHEKAAPQYSYNATLSNKHEAPSVPKEAYGDAKVEFKGEKGDDMNYWIKFTNLHDRVTEGHFHCAPPGVNGPVVAGIFTFPHGQEMKDYIIDGYVNGNMIAATGKDCKTTIGYEIRNMDDLTRAIKEGKIYINVHSKAYPNGVARGQIGAQDKVWHGGTGVSNPDPKKDAHKNEWEKDNHRDHNKDGSWKKHEEKKYEAKDEWKHDTHDDWKKDYKKNDGKKNWNKEESKEYYKQKDWSKDDHQKQYDKKDWNQDDKDWHKDNGKNNSDNKNWKNERKNHW